MLARVSINACTCKHAIEFDGMRLHAAHHAAAARRATAALRARGPVWEDFTYVGNPRTRRERIVVDARRRCLVCDWEEQVTEAEDTDVLGPPCSRCHAPSERIAILARRAEPVTRNLHAAALAQLGASRGGLARAAALTPKRRRDIARAAAQARWKK